MIDSGKFKCCCCYVREKPNSQHAYVIKLCLIKLRSRGERPTIMESKQNTKKKLGVALKIGSTTRGKMVYV